MHGEVSQNNWIDKLTNVVLLWPPCPHLDSKPPMGEMPTPQEETGVCVFPLSSIFSTSAAEKVSIGDCIRASGQKGQSFQVQISCATCCWCSARLDAECKSRFMIYGWLSWLPQTVAWRIVAKIFGNRLLIGRPAGKSLIRHDEHWTRKPSTGWAVPYSTWSRWSLLQQVLSQARSYWSSLASWFTMLTALKTLLISASCSSSLSDSYLSAPSNPKIAAPMQLEAKALPARSPNNFSDSVIGVSNSSTWRPWNFNSSDPGSGETWNHNGCSCKTNQLSLKLKPICIETHGNGGA